MRMMQLRVCWWWSSLDCDWYHADVRCLIGCCNKSWLPRGSNVLVIATIESIVRLLVLRHRLVDCDCWWFAIDHCMPEYLPSRNWLAAIVAVMMSMAMKCTPRSFLMVVYIYTHNIYGTGINIYKQQQHHHQIYLCISLLLALLDAYHHKHTEIAHIVWMVLLHWNRHESLHVMHQSIAHLWMNNAQCIEAMLVISRRSLSHRRMLSVFHHIIP